MTKVDFHIIPALQAVDRFNYAARLVIKATKRQHRVLLAVDDEAQAKHLSEQLWAATPESFIPHSLLDDQDEAIQIGWQAHPGEHHDILINLGQAIPDYFSRFERVFEVVSQDPDVLKQGRNHYRFYQDRGYPLDRHDLRDRV
ncbi:MAG: DNA polymerase III subunit chi [Saccharospirillum sp.]|nr:DNA polymerase III subunit chi [Saccharospirillum sp.]